MYIISGFLLLLMSCLSDLNKIYTQYSLNTRRLVGTFLQLYPLKVKWQINRSWTIEYGSLCHVFIAKSAVFQLYQQEQVTFDELMMST